MMRLCLRECLDLCLMAQGQPKMIKFLIFSSDFTISYLSEDNGQEVYLTMLSDWDMDAAFQNASDPCLRLKVDLKPFDESK